MATIKGTTGDDTLLGTEENDRIWGLAGDDTLDGGDGDDSLADGAGDDLLRGGDGDDVLHTGDGDDVAFGGAGNDRLVGFAGYDVLLGGAGDDWIDAPRQGHADGGDGYDILTIDLDGLEEPVHFDAASGSTQTGLTFVGFEGISAHVSGDQDNTLRGSDRSEVLDSASTGDDVLEGGGGIDTLIDSGPLAGSGDDRLLGGDGDDRLQTDGGGGADELVGGAGADWFYWYQVPPPGEGAEGVDHVVDFDTESGDAVVMSEATLGTIGITTFDDFIAASRDTAAGVYVSFDGSDDYGILIENVSLADLTPNDFVFDYGGA